LNTRITEVAQLAGADDDDGAGDGVDLRRKTVKDTIGDLQQAGAKGGVVADDAADIRGGVAGAVDHFVDLQKYFRQRSDLNGAGNQFPWADAHALPLLLGVSFNLAAVVSVDGLLS
jgi:CxxC motif-containing protein (DUF1111 family)